MGIYADTKLALKAWALAKKGLKGKVISEAVSTKRQPITTDQASTLAAVGAGVESEAFCKLSDREEAILLALAAITRERRAVGDTSSPKAKYIAWRLRLSEGQVRRATKHLDIGGHYNELRLGLLEHSRNGHIWLLPAGWAVVQVIEATKAATRRQISADIDKAAREANCGCSLCHGHPEWDAAFERAAEIAAGAA